MTQKSRRYRTELINFRMTPAERDALEQLARTRSRERPLWRYQISGGKRPGISEYLLELVAQDAKARGVAFPAVATDAESAESSTP